MSQVNSGTVALATRPVQARLQVVAEPSETSPDYQPQDLVALRDQIMQHLEVIGLTSIGSTPAKQAVRDAHAPQRQEARSRIVRAFGPRRVQHYALHCLALARFGVCQSVAVGSCPVDLNVVGQPLVGEGSAVEAVAVGYAGDAGGEGLTRLGRAGDGRATRGRSVLPRL